MFRIQCSQVIFHGPGYRVPGSGFRVEGSGVMGYLICVSSEHMQVRACDSHLRFNAHSGSYAQSTSRCRILGLGEWRTILVPDHNRLCFTAHPSKNLRRTSRDLSPTKQGTLRNSSTPQKNLKINLSTPMKKSTGARVIGGGGRHRLGYLRRHPRCGWCGPTTLL